MHKTFKVLFLLLIGLLVGCAGMDKVKDPSSFVKHMNNSTVALVLSEDGDVRPYCTGVWLEDNLIATAHHCVQSVANHIAKSHLPKEIAEQLEIDVDVIGVKIHYIQVNEVMGIGEEPSAVHLSKVILDDADHDVALIKAVGDAIPAHDYAVMADNYPAVGEKIYVVGHVKGLYWTYIEGVVAGYRAGLPVDKNGPFIQLSAPVYFGNSGGGVFNSDGEVVGIVSFMMGAPLTNFAIPIKRVRALVKESHEKELKILNKKHDE